MTAIEVSPFDLGLAAILVLMLALLTVFMRTGQWRPLLFSAARAAVQLILVGLVLETVFANARGLWIFLMMLGMLLVAGHEVVARQKRRFRGWWGYSLGTVSMFVSTCSMLLIALLVMLQPEPWYQPQYAIPLLGMLLGNSMTGIALALDRLTEGAWQSKDRIEARLMLGLSWKTSVSDLRLEAMRSGLLPIINAMAAAGVVSLPGMMTGQILAGVSPLEAVKYQILILFLISVASGLGSVIAIHFGSRRLFDECERLVLNRLMPPQDNR
ncbi:MAG TPA: iron export ABC transporter permease subunit FetB [Gammaproteobacteria bacterium]|nr:iron export ABC transporter permease subunit FetB [Gammaproteobacteria bacterium]